MGSIHVVYWFSLPLLGFATFLMSWHYSQGVKPLTERIRLVDEPFWFLLRFAILAFAVVPLFIWGHWAVGLGGILAHAVVVMRVGAAATNRRVVLETRKLTEEGVPAAEAVTIAEQIVKENADTNSLPREFSGFADEPRGAWDWVREGRAGFFSLFRPVLDPFFSAVRHEQIAQYQRVLDSIFETIDISNYHLSGELARIQRDNDHADSIAKSAASQGLSPFSIQVMLTQFFYADLYFRELDREKWAWVCQRCRPIDYFPSGTVVAQRDFAHNIIG